MFWFCEKHPDDFKDIFLWILPIFYEFYQPLCILKYVREAIESVSNIKD